MSETIRKGATKPNECRPDYSDVKFPTWEELIEQDRVEKRAAEAAKQSEPVAATVTRLIEENSTQRKAVTAKQYAQATKLQVGSEVFNMGLTNNELVVWFYLVRCSNNERKSFPSISSISQHCQCRRETAIEAIRTLEDKKIISSERRYHKPTIYTLRPAQDWCSLTVE